MFAPGDFYLELMPTPTPEQETLNGELVRMSKKLGIPLVATNDCHYVNRTDAQAHDVLMAIQTGKSLKDEKRLKHVVDSYYMKSESEMNAAFKDVRRSRRERRQDRRDVQRQAQARPDAHADLQGPRGRVARLVHGRDRDARARPSVQGAHRVAASSSTPTSIERAAIASSA